jgi:hypothetical protein
MSHLAPVPAANVLLPALPYAEPQSEAVLFGFDHQAFPFQHHVQTHLIPGLKPQLVIPRGESGSHDESIVCYGTVVEIDGRFHIWYTGHTGSEPKRRRGCSIYYATSEDGIHWEKPDLGLVEFNGSTRNNIVDLPYDALSTPCAVLYEPDDPDPARRYKLAFEAPAPEGGPNRFCVAFSADGLRWVPHELNPVGPFFEMMGVTRFHGLYYASGQAEFTAHGPVPARRLCAFVSSDFVHWSPISAVGLDRAPDLTGPSTAAGLNQYEEIHLGAALWNRGNVILGVYGQWHGHPSGDRRVLTMDLGLALSHDGLHFTEPIRDFPFIPAREQPQQPAGSFPALIQGQAFANRDDRTLYWYSAWRGAESAGVLMVSWERDRLGALRPFQPDDARAISCPIEITAGEAPVAVNVSGLGEHTTLRIGLLDEGFRPVPAFSGNDAAVLAESGLRQSIRWPNTAGIPAALGRVRLDIRFEGVRPEDAALHAVYIGEA